MQPQQRWLRIARWTLGIAFFAVVGYIALNWNSKVKPRREKSNVEPVASTRPGDKARLESMQFDDTQTIGGRVVSRIRARRVVSYSSDWNTLEDVEITIYRPNNLTYLMTCPQAQFNNVTKEADAKGGVHVVSSDGVEIHTAEIKFDGNRLTNDIPVQFKIDRWTGSGGALDLDVQGETLRLFKTLTAQMTPATPAEAPMTVKSQEGLFRRKENDVTFTQDVNITRAADLLASDRVVGRFTQDRKTLIGLEGQGHVHMVMASNVQPGENLGGKKDITCDRFFSEVAPNGQINAINAVGEQALAHAVLDGPPKRDIVARGFRIALENKAVREMKADWEVVMTEFAEATRKVSGEHVTVSFDPAAHRATTAYIEGAFRYTDPKTTATAFRASYDITNDRVLLTTDPGWDATVVSDGQTLKAKQIEFSPKAQTAKATGDVIAQLASKGGGPTADATNLFPSGKPVFVNSDTLLMRQAQKVAIFTGNVRAWQETNTMLANEMQVQGAGTVVVAKGNVRTLLFNTTSGETRKTPMTSQSEQLVAKKNERRIDLTGNVHIVDETRTVNSERATFFMDANKKIERIDAEGKVQVQEKATNRTGTGDHAIYQVQKKLAMLDGSPATVTDPKGSLSGQQIMMDLARDKVQVVSKDSPTTGTYKHEP